MRIPDQAINRLRILKAIRGVGAVSRTEIAAMTGLSPATITEVTTDLLSRKLLVEERRSNSGRGRPRELLSINAAASLVIGARMLSSGIFSTSFIDLAGTRQFVHEAPIEPPTCLSEVTTVVAEILERAISASPYESSHIDRAAIALPAIIDSANGVMHWMPTLQGEPQPIAEALSGRLEIPVTVENNSASLARAEHWFGRARSLDDFSIFQVNLTIGSAHYSGGIPRIGANGFNSELAHTKTGAFVDGPTCGCGARGCLAGFSSVLGLLVRSGKVARFNFRSIAEIRPAYNELLAEAESGQNQAKRLFTDAGHHLGIAVANHINGYDPVHVFVLLPDERFLDLVREPLERSLAENVLAFLVRKTRVEIDVPSPDWSWKGAAAHALEELYLNPAKPS